jgi:hypothetical protein
MDHSSANNGSIEIVIDKTNRWNMRSPEWVASFHPDSDREYFRSMYRWPKEALGSISEWKRLGKSGSGIEWKGNIIADHVVIDIDYKTTHDTLIGITKPLSQAIEAFCPSNTFGIYASGSGIHVHFSKELFGIDPSPDVPHITKYVAMCLEGHISNTYKVTIDTMLYHQSGTYRMPLSMNPKVGRRKILLYGRFDDNFESTEPVLSYMANYSPPKKAHKPAVTSDVPQVTPCMTQVWNDGYAVNKERYGRHETVMALASWFVFNHMPKDIAYQSILSWIEKANIPYDQPDTLKVIEDVYAGKYFFGCHANIPSKHCLTSCRLYDRKNNPSSSGYRKKT